MDLTDIKKSMTKMSVGELNELVEGIRKRRQENKNVQPDKAPSAKGSSAAQKLKTLLGKLSPVEQQALMDQMEADNE